MGTTCCLGADRERSEKKGGSKDPKHSQPSRNPKQLTGFQPRAIVTEKSFKVLKNDDFSQIYRREGNQIHRTSILSIIENIIIFRCHFHYLSCDTYCFRYKMMCNSI